MGGVRSAGDQVGSAHNARSVNGAVMVKGIGGIAGWLIKRLEQRTHREARLELQERLTLAPRQSLALVEADGQRILVAISAEGAPAFYPLDGRSLSAAKLGASRRTWKPAKQRVSW